MQNLHCQSRMTLHMLGALGLCLAIASAPAQTESVSSPTHLAMTRTKAVCGGLVRGDASWLEQATAGSPVRHATQAHLEELQQLAPEELKRPISLDDDGWSRAVAGWGNVFKGGNPFIGRPRASAGKVAIPVRFQTALLTTHWEFHYEIRNSRPVLQRISLPFDGMDLSHWMAERIFYTTYEDLPLDQHAPLLDASVNTMRNVLIVVLVVFIAAIFLRIRSKRQTRSTLKSKGFIVVAVILVAIVAAQFVIRSRKEPEQESITPTDQKKRLFVDRLRLHQCMTGRPSEAERLATDILMQRPDDRTVELQLLQALTMQRKAAEATPRLQEMAKADQTDTNLRIFALDRLAKLASATKQYNDVVKHLLQVCKEFGEDAAVLVRIADALDKAGQPDEAEVALKRALKATPGDADALLLHARLAMRKEDFDAAAQDLRKLKKHYGLNIVLLERDLDFSELKKNKDYADIFMYDDSL